jgi:hypothetical protein
LFLIAAFASREFSIGLLGLTLIAYLQARGLYFERGCLIAPLSLGVTVATALWHWLIGATLILPHHHRGHVWIPGREELTYPLDAAIGGARYLALRTVWRAGGFRQNQPQELTAREGAAAHPPRAALTKTGTPGCPRLHG